MHYPRYELSANDDFTVFEFVSKGQNGCIHKAIKYSMTTNSQVYNLGFGDIISDDEKTGEVEIDDEAVSNNGDIRMVLATVAWSVYIFTNNHPGAMVLCGGSNVVKTRLYRMILSRYHKEITKTFLVFGAVRNPQGQIVNAPFPDTQNNIGFFVRRK